jgi:SOS-response transcriptional repressor LexA
LAPSVNYLSNTVPAHVFRMGENDDISADVTTWDQLKARLSDRPRGAGYKLAQALGMNSSFFYRKLKGRGELSAGQAKVVRAFLSDEDLETPAPPRATESRSLPVFGYAAAGGEETIALNEGQIIEWLQLPLGLELGPGDWFAVRSIGSSMEPRIFPGEYLVVRRGFPPGHNKDVVVEFTDGTGVVKTYKAQRDGRVFVEQFNPQKGLDYDATKVRRLHGVAFKI